MTNITDLAAELLALIVRNLDQHRDLLEVSHVNVSFFQATSPVLWRTIHLHGLVDGFRFIRSLGYARPSIHPLIRSVYIEDFPWTPHTLPFVMARTPLLTSFQLNTGARITDDVMIQLPRFWPRLQTLSLTNTPITHTAYSAIGQECDLSSLSLIRCNGYRSDLFSTCFANTRLERLTIESTLEQQQQQEAWTVNQATTLDLSTLSSLTHLTICGPPFGMLQNLIDKEGGVFTYLPLLRSVTIEASFDNMDDGQAIGLIRGLAGGGVTHIALRDSNFRSFVLHIIPIYHRSTLITLDLSANRRITAHSIRYLVSRCNLLSLLTIQLCGFTSLDFPEIGIPHFINGIPVAIDHLDRDALQAIRQNA